MKTKPCKIREDIHIVPLIYSTIWKRACENVCFWYSGLSSMPNIMAMFDCRIVLFYMKLKIWTLNPILTKENKVLVCYLQNHFFLVFCRKSSTVVTWKRLCRRVNEDWLGNPIRRKFANNSILLKLFPENRMDDVIMRSPSCSPLLKTRGVWPDL